MEKRFFLCFFIVSFFLPYLVLAQYQPQERNISVETIVGHPTEPPEPPNYITPGGIFPDTKIVFKGRAYPGAFMTLLKDGEVASTFFATEEGFFEREISGLESGTYDFGIWGEDKEQRKSVTLEFSLDILKWTKTTVSGIFLSPTMEIKPSSVERGENIDIFGQSFPRGIVHIFVFPQGIIKETQTDARGRWFYKMNTFFLKEGSYSVKSKAESDMGSQSDFSHSLPFSVVPRGSVTCWGPDLNFDGKVDVMDLGILMYFWEEETPQNYCADINSEGGVDVYDFSLMMYWWSE